MADERERMARVTCEGLLTGEATEMLGDYPDADLRRIMGYIAKDMGRYVERLEIEKAARQKAREERKLEPDSEAGQEMIPGPVFEPVPGAGSRSGEDESYRR